VKLAGRYELLEARYVPLDPVEDGFLGVLVEIRHQETGDGEEYQLLSTAVGSGNRLLSLVSASPALVYELFEREVGDGVRPVSGEVP
jgi:hypothetical protein